MSMFAFLTRGVVSLAAVLCVLLLVTAAATAQSGRSLYNQINAPALTGGTATVSNLVLKRDRVTLTFNGTFYFMPAIEGRVTGAVFIGNGNFQAEIPPNEFEKANIKRLLGVENAALESDFKTAVFRFTDNTFQFIGKNKTEGEPVSQASKLASELQGRILEQTGVNLASRIALSILNHELPGMFFAEFDGGKRGRFDFIYDPQNRIPTDYFGINGGEKGLIFDYNSATMGNDIWMAFYGIPDYQRGSVSYSDLNDTVDITHYDMNIDLRVPRKKLGLRTKISMKSRVESLRAINFTIGENLGEFEDQRLKKQMRVQSARIGGNAVKFVQEDWESGFTVFLPDTVPAGAPVDLELDIEGDFLRQPANIDFDDCSYPRSNDAWYPRQGYLDRSTFDLSFTHPKNRKVASVGTRKTEVPDPENKDMTITKYEMKYPVALVTFAVGPFVRHVESIKWENGDPATPLEFSSLGGSRLALKEDFMLAELSNSVRYFHALFGKYPYETYSAVFHPYGFGQGFPSMLTIPNADRANKATFSFIAHETAHQWWGNIVAWRSYRDQWLSEGFADYSGIIYTGFRQSPGAAFKLVEDMRWSLKQPPETLRGIGKGRLVDIGPVILGHRLETRKTMGAYSALIYNKGALILRMVHMLLTDPTTGNGEPFYNMMKDFVARHRDGVASTDDFRKVANEHFAKSPLAKRYNLVDMNWFFNQWVYGTELPTYGMTYQIEPQPDGTVIFSGTVTQENAGEKWFMPLPVVFHFPGKKTAFGTVAAYGPSTPFKIKLPAKPDRIELDPDKWVLSEKTSMN